MDLSFFAQLDKPQEPYHSKHVRLYVIQSTHNETDRFLKMDVVAYYRVSTKGQGESGLGLEAQREYVLRAASQHGWTIVTEYVETVSGTVHPLERPEGAKAFDHGLPVVVAKLDRLSRRVSHIASLMESHPFKVATMPTATPFELHLFAALAEQERTFISQRTKEALQSLQVRADAGDIVAQEKVQRRAQSASKAIRSENVVKARQARINQANAQARKVEAMLALARSKGHSSLRAIAGFLNEHGVTTAQGKQHTACSVQRLLTRLAA